MRTKRMKITINFYCEETDFFSIGFFYFIKNYYLCIGKKYNV